MHFFTLCSINDLVCFYLNSFSPFARDVLINLPNVKDRDTSFSFGEIKASGALLLLLLGWAGAFDAISNQDFKKIVTFAYAGRAQTAINKVAFQ